MRRYRGNRHRQRRIAVGAAGIILAVLAVGCICYIRDFYPADESALAALESGDCVGVEITKDAVIFAPEGPTVGLVFYPGGKVEFTAYTPLMAKLAEKNVQVGQFLRNNKTNFQI